MLESELDILRAQYAGSYIARRGSEVVASTETFDELCDRLDEMPIDQSTLIIEYIDPIDRVCVY
jgi:hypothetical protein